MTFRVILVLCLFAAITGGHGPANAETRPQFLRVVECAAAFLKTGTIFRAERAIGTTTDGQKMTLEKIDFWDQRARVLVEFLFNESAYANEAETQLSAEMDAWLAVFENATDQRIVVRTKSLALTTALECNKEFMAAKWFP